MANLTGKHADKIPGNGGFVNSGPAFDPDLKKPVNNVFNDGPHGDVPHVTKHDTGIGGPSDRNNNGIDDSEE
nr:MAG TPA: hypothetical protein [Caudoviricetes sp.]